MWYISFMARSTAAASELPPAMPAHTGMCLSMWMSSTSPCPVAERKAAAAFWARLLPSAGRKDRLVDMLPSPGVRVRVSVRSMDTITICKS